MREQKPSPVDLPRDSLECDIGSNLERNQIKTSYNAMLVKKTLSVTFTVLSRDPTCDQLINNSGHYIPSLF